MDWLHFRDIDGAGYYALYIIQGDQIKNVTVLKRLIPRP